MAAVAGVPANFKALQHHLKTAVEHDKRDPVVAYYCRLYAFQRGMEIDKKSPDCRNFLALMMNMLEEAKTQHKDLEAIQNEIVGQAHLEDYALKLFLYADNEDRAGRFGKNVVKSFYTAGMLMDVLTTFGEVSEDIEKNRKYAKWKAAYIHNCLKNGETPVSGPMADDSEMADLNAEFGAAEIGAAGASSSAGPMDVVPPQQPSSAVPHNVAPMPGYNQPGYSQPGVPGYNMPPAGYMPNVNSQPVPAPRGSPSPVHRGQHVPPPAAAVPPQPAGAVGGSVVLKSEDFTRAMKLCKFASSALQYEDTKSAVENLTKALNLLTTGHE